MLKLIAKNGKQIDDLTTYFDVDKFNLEYCVIGYKKGMEDCVRLSFKMDTREFGEVQLYDIINDMEYYIELSDDTDGLMPKKLTFQIPFIELNGMKVSLKYYDENDIEIPYNSDSGEVNIGFFSRAFNYEKMSNEYKQQERAERLSELEALEKYVGDE